MFLRREEFVIYWDNMTSLEKFDPGFSYFAVLFDREWLLSRDISFFKQGNKKIFSSERSEREQYFLIAPFEKLISLLIN